MTPIPSHVTAALDAAFLLLPRHLDTPAARVLLLAIGLQESRLVHRYQVLLHSDAKGPARGYWQFEQGTRASRGGVWGVYLHRASSELLRQLCRDRDVSFDPRAIWERIEHDDVLAAGLARLLLWTDSVSLPRVGEVRTAWDYYLRNWRPGKPHAQTWAGLYACAQAEVQAR